MLGGIGWDLFYIESDWKLDCQCKGKVTYGGVIARWGDVVVLFSAVLCCNGKGDAL